MMKKAKQKELRIPFFHAINSFKTVRAKTGE